MTKPAEIAAMIKTAETTLGSVDVLVNNAGIQYVAPIEEFPIEKWDQIIAINLSSAFHATRAAVPGMKARKWGRIISTASAHSLVASPFKVAYVSAKHGIAGFTKTIALELATFGVTVNCISPGYVWTPLVAKQIPDTMKARNMTEEQVIERRAAGGAADQAVRDRRTGGVACALFVLRRGGADHRRQSFDRRRLDGGLMRTTKATARACGRSHAGCRADCREKESQSRPARWWRARARLPGACSTISWKTVALSSMVCPELRRAR